jgi:hypothetical protein
MASPKRLWQSPHGEPPSERRNQADVPLGSGSATHSVWRTQKSGICSLRADHPGRQRCCSDRAGWRLQRAGILARHSLIAGRHPADLASPIPVHRRRPRHAQKLQYRANGTLLGHTVDVRAPDRRNLIYQRHVEPIRAGPSVLHMRTIWRFFVDGSGRWSWEELQPDKSLVRRSASSFEHYDECVADAKRSGYKFEASQDSSPRSMSVRKRT